MTVPRNPDHQVPTRNIAEAKLVSGILDCTYKAAENAQIALERSRQTQSKRKSNSSSESLRKSAPEATG